jgi:hypothetical protein
MLANDDDKCASFKRKCAFAVSNPFVILGLLFVSFSEAGLVHDL